MCKQIAMVVVGAAIMLLASEVNAQDVYSPSNNVSYNQNVRFHLQSRQANAIVTVDVYKKNGANYVFDTTFDVQTDGRGIFQKTYQMNPADYKIEFHFPNKTWTKTFSVF